MDGCDDDDVCSDCQESTVIEIRGQWVCTSCGVVGRRAVCDEELCFEDARSSNTPAPFSSHALDPERLFVSGGPSSKYAVGRSFRSAVIRSYESGLRWLEQVCIGTFGFTRLQFSMTKEFWWGLCSARIERKDTGDSDAQFSYRQESVELPTVVFHHIESFGLPFILADVCHVLRADFQQITNKLRKWRHPIDGVMVEPQTCAIILGRARRLFRLQAQERGVDLRFADLIDGICQAFIHNHIRHVTPFAGFAVDVELASCTMFAVISNRLVMHDDQLPDITPTTRAATAIVSNKRRRKGGIKVLKMLNPNREPRPVDDSSLLMKPVPPTSLQSPIPLKKISQFAPSATKRSRLQLPIASVDRQDGHTTPGACAGSTTNALGSTTELTVPSSPLAVHAFDHNTTTPPQVVTTKGVYETSVRCLLTGSVYTRITQDSAFLTGTPNPARWLEFYGAWEREWLQLHVGQGWAQFVDSVYASYGQFLAHAHQCRLLVQYPLILQYVGHAFPSLQ